MRKFVLSFICLLILAQVSFAQDDETFYKNFGMNIGYAVAVPKYPAIDGFKKHFDGESGFSHVPMNLENTVSQGFSGGFSLFGFHDYMDFEYRVLATKGTYDLPKNSVQENYTFKFYQHTARYSYNRGITFGKYGLVGLYAGAGIYAGTFGMKIKDPFDKKFQSLSVDGFRNFTIGISPQLTVRLRFFELKAFYDYPFLSHNISPVYNKMFQNAGATDASVDAGLNGKFTNFGVSATFFIAFGKPKPRPQPYAETAEDRARLQQFNNDQKDFNNKRQKENEDSRRRIEDMQRKQERENKRSSDKWGK